jgi:replicative DNA helicase
MVKEFNNITSTALPPQNIEAEESILGGILLDPEAIGRVADILTPASFSISTHQTIYLAAQSLHAQSKPTDIMTVTVWLQDQGFLEQVGGTAKLAQLVDRTVSAVNIDKYAELVKDKYLRRQLIWAGHEIAELGYDTSQELEVILDKAEQKIFRLNENRPQQGLTPISDTLSNTFTEIENLHQNLVQPGIETGFYDFDAMTSGLQRSDLIIIAGRPSMGKTAFGLGIAANVAKNYNLPVAIFSLEMSKEQLAQRLLASEARIPGNQLRSGNLSQVEIDKLIGSLTALSELPIFIDDSASTSVMQIRSLSRRLQAEQGELGMILLDYLQLMEGATDNRVQELSRMTRGLKTLARELNVPVISLSQLSRGVEQRNNKRPMMSDLRESGSIEQDADLVIMLYRDSYYNPDSPDRDTAEVIITKHRNGPTGTVKLGFKAETTTFLNLATPSHY